MLVHASVIHTYKFTATILLLIIEGLVDFVIHLLACYIVTIDNFVALELVNKLMKSLGKKAVTILVICRILIKLELVDLIFQLSKIRIFLYKGKYSA